MPPKHSTTTNDDVSNNQPQDVSHVGKEQATSSKKKESEKKGIKKLLNVLAIFATKIIPVIGIGVAATLDSTPEAVDIINTRIAMQPNIQATALQEETYVETNVHFLVGCTKKARPNIAMHDTANHKEPLSLNH